MIHVVYVTFLEKDVGFVKEEYGRLCDGILEDLLQPALRLLGIGTQISPTDSEKWTFLSFCQ